MKEKKFDIVSITISAFSFFLGFFGMSLEGVIAGVIAIILSIKRKDVYRTKIAIVVSIIAIIISVGFFAFLCYHHLKYNSTTDYWLFELLFGKMPE